MAVMEFEFRQLALTQRSNPFPVGLLGALAQGSYKAVEALAFCNLLHTLSTSAASCSHVRHLRLHAIET